MGRSEGAACEEPVFATDGNGMNLVTRGGPSGRPWFWNDGQAQGPAKSTTVVILCGAVRRSRRIHRREPVLCVDCSDFSRYVAVALK